MWQYNPLAAFFVLVRTGLLLVLLPGCGDDPKRPLGATCESDSECISGLCIDSLCLDPDGDEDGDTLSNGLEDGLGTSPFMADSDLDGEADPDELDPVLRTHLDADLDGKPDALESATADADGDCIVDELDPADGTVDPEGCNARTGDWSCGAIHQAARTSPSGAYLIDPDEDGPEAPLRVECLMNVANGGWTRLTAAWNDWLLRAPVAPVPRREYLPVGSGGWARRPGTHAPGAVPARARGFR